MGNRITPRKVKCAHCRRVYWTTGDSKFCTRDCFDDYKDSTAHYLPTLEEIAIAKAEIKAENDALSRDRQPVAVLDEWEDDECL